MKKQNKKIGSDYHVAITSNIFTEVYFDILIAPVTEKIEQELKLLKRTDEDSEFISQLKLIPGEIVKHCLFRNSAENYDFDFRLMAYTAEMEYPHLFKYFFRTDFLNPIYSELRQALNNKINVSDKLRIIRRSVELMHRNPKIIAPSEKF